VGEARPSILPLGGTHDEILGQRLINRSNRMPSKGTKKSVWAANEMIGRVLLLAADIELWVEKPNIQDVALCGLSDYASTGDPCVIHASIQMMQQTQMNRALRLRCARLSDKGIQRSNKSLVRGGRTTECRLTSLSECTLDPTVFPTPADNAQTQNWALCMGDAVGQM